MSVCLERQLQVSGRKALRDRNIIVTNNQVVHVPEIVDQPVAMLRTLAREIHTFLGYE